MLVTNLCMRRCPLPFSGTSEPIRSYFKWLDSMTSTNFARRASNLHHQTDKPPLGCRTQSSAQRVGQCPPTRVQIGRHYVPNLFVVDSLFEIAAYNTVALLIRIPPYTRVFRSGLVFFLRLANVCLYLGGNSIAGSSHYSKCIERKFDI